MGTRAASCPGSRLLSLGVWLVVAARTVPHAEAEISCASCPSAVQLHREEIQLGVRANRGAASFRSIRAEFRDLGISGLEAGLERDRERDREAGDSEEDEFQRDEVPAETGGAGEDAALRRARRSGPELEEFGDSGWTGGAGLDPGSQVDGQRSVRWNREDGRGINRQEEAKLSSSTFALTGDSAHNHAVVYWSGHNSSNQDCKSPDGSEDKGGGGFGEDQMIYSVKAPEGPDGSGRCEESSSELEQLNNSEERPFTCDHCEKTFKWKCYLKRHQRVHTGEKPFTCDHCEKGFKHKGALKVHQRIHTGEKPYTCDHCEKGFKHKGDLKVHQRIHTGEKPYTCDHCEKGFRHKGALTVHQRVHTGEKPYTCDHCEKGFKQKGALKRHQIIHTREKP